MYKYRKTNKGLINNPVLMEGESIETKVKRLIENKEPIKDGAPLIYTDRKSGVNAAYNIKTDRFELAAEAMDKITRSRIAKREEAAKKENDAKVVKMKDVGEAEPAPGKADKNQSK